MPVEYELDKDGTFVRVKATGHVTSREINDFLLRLGADPGLQQDHVTLFDTTEATSEAVDDLDFEQALAIEKGNPEKLIARKMAIVAREWPFLRLALNYHSVSPLIGEPTQVFSNIDEAVEWLEQPGGSGRAIT